MDNPDQIFEEVKQLQAEMQQLEKQLGEWDERNDFGGVVNSSNLLNFF